MAKQLRVTAPVLVAFLLVVLVEAIATHAIARDASGLTHAILAAVHLSAVAWLVARYAATRREVTPD